jgi:hypothetical protein
MGHLLLVEYNFIISTHRICNFRALANKENIEYSAEAIDNLDIPHVEASDGFRSGMRAWNRTVQFWLANFVYKRSNKAIR